MSDIVIVGGPNGAGKTTAAKVLLPEIGIGEFVNADEIARGLIAAGHSFAFETTCSGRAYAPLLQRCKAEGWRIGLLFLWPPNAELALGRVARRVVQGGHSSRGRPAIPRRPAHHARALPASGR